MPADAAAIASIHIRAWQAAYRGQLPDAFLDRLSGAVERRTSQWVEWLNRSSRTHATWVAVRAGQVSGFVHAGSPMGDDLPADVGEIYMIYLEPEVIGQGVGRRLMVCAENSLRDLGRRSAVLWVLESNTRARRFYEAAGWAFNGRSQDLAIGGATVRELRYAKALAPER